MEFQEYQESAMRTNNDKGFDLNCLHGVTGMLTELGEVVDAYKRNIWYGTALDVTNVTEEVGDILWYEALLSHTINSTALTLSPLGEESVVLDLAPSSTITNTDILKLLLEISSDVGSLCLLVATAEDLGIKGETLATGIDMRMYTIHFQLRILCDLTGISMEKAAEVNIAKLKARFPDKFTEEAAVNRNTITERNLLESQVNN